MVLEEHCQEMHSLSRERRPEAPENRDGKDHIAEGTEADKKSLLMFLSKHCILNTILL